MVATSTRPKATIEQPRYSSDRSQAKPPMLTFSMALRDFQILGKIGSGHFGKIYAAKYRGIEVALKRFSKERLTSDERRGSRGMELLRREIEIHSRLDHPHILPFLGIVSDLTTVSIVLEHASKGDLFTHAIQYTDAQDRLDKARLYLYQIVCALRHLSKYHIAHRDIKPENILVCDDECVKLGDFGWAVEYSFECPQKTLCGTGEYLPPEMLVPRGDIAYQAAFVDQWSLGVLAFELYYNVTPFKADSPRQVFDRIRRFRGFSVSSNESNRSYKDFVAQLLRIQPTERLSPSKALCHPFFDYL